MKMVAKKPRISITWPMFMSAAIIFVMVSLTVKPAMETDMKRAPRRLEEMATR